MSGIYTLPGVLLTPPPHAINATVPAINDMIKSFFIIDSIRWLIKLLLLVQVPLPVFVLYHKFRATIRFLRSVPELLWRRGPANNWRPAFHLLSTLAQSPLQINHP